MISIDATPTSFRWDRTTHTKAWLSTVRLRITLNPSGRMYTHTILTRTIEVPSSQRNWSARARIKHAINSSPELRAELQRCLTNLAGDATALTKLYRLTP